MGVVRQAACGVDCGACAQYKVTMNLDKEAAAQLVDWFKSQNWLGEADGADEVLQKAPLCKGCWDITEDCFWQCGCGRVDFRRCCDEKKIENCGACVDFPCGHYTEWSRWHDSHREAMERFMAAREKAQGSAT